jgi:methionyl aminopeptidase
MSIEKPEDLEALREIGRIVGLTIQEVRRYVRPGITTAELDEIGERFLSAHGAVAAPRRTYGFPGSIMISINDEAVHSVPGERRIEPGDLVKIDVTLERDGYYADAALTVAVPPVENLQHNLIQAAQAAFRKGARMARAGNRVNDIGRAVETEVRRRGFTVLRDLSGHGVGRSIHEEPQVPNVYDPRSNRRLTEGLVLTIEPIIANGASKVKTDDDRWTTRTVDGSLSAHYEHTLVITRDRPILLTQVAEG